MRNMNPKTILSPRNIVGALVIAVTAAFLFAGTWLIYNEFVKAAPGDGTYVANDSGISSVLVEFASDPNQVDNVIACPEGFSPEAVCYNPSVITSITPATREGVGILAVVKGTTLSKPANTALVIFNDINAFDQALDGYSIGITNLGGITATINNIMPAGGGGGPTVVYSQANQAYGGKTVFVTSPLTGGGTPITTTDQTVACPEGDAFIGKTCMNLNLATFLNATGLAQGASISTIVISGDSSSEFTIIMNSTNLVVDNQALELKVSAFNNVSQMTTTTFEEAAPPTATYMSNDPVFGGATIVSPVFKDAFSSAGETACPEGAIYAEKICFNIASVTNLSGDSLIGGIDASDVVAVVKNGDNKSVTVVMNAPNIATNLGNLSITLNNFGGVSQAQITTNFTVPTKADYTASNATFGNKSTLGAWMPIALDGATNTIDCTSIGIMEGGAVCYNGNSVTAKTSITGNVVALVRGTLSTVNYGSNYVVAIFDANNVIADPNNASITFNNFGGVQTQQQKTTFTVIEGGSPPPPPTMTYDSGISLNTATFYSSNLVEDALSSAGEVACPEGDAYAGKTCFNTAGVTALSGDGLKVGIDQNDVVAIVKEGTKAVKVVMNAKGVILNLKNVSMTLNNFGGIPETTYTSFSVPNGGAYTASDSSFGNKSSVGFQVTQKLDNATNTIDCTTIGVMTEGAVCYNKNSVVLSGTGWAEGITSSNVRGLVRGDFVQSGGQSWSDNAAVLVFDATNVIADTNTAVIAFNNAGGITQEVTRSAFGTMQAPPPEPGPTASYRGYSIANGATWITSPLAESLTSAGETACPQGDFYSGKTCFDKSQVTLTGAGLKEGIDTADIVAVVKNEGPSVTIVMNAQNVINSLEGGITLVVNGFGGITETTFTNFDALPGNVDYSVANANFASKSTMAIATPLALDNSTNIIDCTTIGVMTEGAVCYNKNSVSLTGTGWTEGITAGNARGVLRGDFAGFSDNIAFVIFDTGTVIADVSSASITFNNAGGLTQAVTKSTFNVLQPAPPQLSHTYLNTDTTFGDQKTTLKIQFAKQLDASQNVVTCPESVTAALGQSPICYNTNTLVFNSGFDGSATATALIRGDFVTGKGYTQSDLVVVLSAPNMVTGDPQSTQVTFTNIGGTSSAICNNIQAQSVPETPSQLYNPHLSFKTAILVLPVTGDKNTNKVACNAETIGMELTETATCYDLSTITVNGLKDGITATYAMQGDSTVTNYGFDSTKLIIGLSNINPINSAITSLSVDLQNTGGVIKSITTFQQQGINYAQYKNDNADWGNMTTAITAPLTEGRVPNWTGKTVACPAEGFDGKTCINQTGFNFSGGELKEGVSLKAIVVASTGNQFIFVWDNNNVITNSTGLSVTIPEIDIITAKTLQNFINIGGTPPPPPAPTGEYLPVHEMMTGTSVMLLPPYGTEISTDATEAIECNANILAMLDFFALTENIYCYDPALVTSLSGNSLKTSVGISDIWAVVRLDAFDEALDASKRLAVIFNQPDVAFGTDSLSITIGAFDGKSITTTNTWGWGGDFTEFDPMIMGSDDQVWMEMLQPAPFSQIPTNLKNIKVVFSGPLNGATITTNNIKLKDSSNGSEVSLTLSKTNLNDGATSIDIAFAGLSNDKTYTLSMEGIQDGNGKDVYAQYFDFYTNSSMNPVAPVGVSYSTITQGATGVDPAMTVDAMIGYVGTIATSGTGVTISPEVSGMTYEFDSRYNAYHLYFANPMANDTEYTISINGNGNVKDIYGFTISNYNLSFTTGTASSDSPQLTWFDPIAGYSSGETIVGGEIKVGISMPLNSAAKTANNWALTCDGTPIDLSGLPVDYNLEEWRIAIYDTAIPPNTNSCTLTAGATITGLNGVAFDGGDKAITGSPAEEYKYYEEGTDWAWGGCISDCTTANKWQDPMMMMMGGIEFQPSTKLAGQSADEVWVSLPVTQEIKTGDQLVIELPTGSSVDINNLEVFAQDINGSNAGKISLINPSYTSSTRKLKLTFSVDSNEDGTEDALGKASNFQAEFVFTKFTNPTTSSAYDWSTGNGGVYATFSTQTSTLQPVETIGQSAPYSVEAGGSGAISGKVVNAVDNITGVAGVTVFLESWKTGRLSATTAGDGTYSFSSLPTSEALGSNWGVDYFIGVEPKEGYVVTATENFVYLDNSTTTKSGLNFKVRASTTNVNIAFTHNLSANKDFVVEARNLTDPKFAKKNIQASGGEGSLEFILGLVPGEWEVCIRADMMVQTMNVGTENFGDNSFIDSCKTISIDTGVTSYDLAMGLTSSDSTISGTVTDGDGNAVAGARVFAYNAYGGFGGGEATTGNDGTYSMSLPGDKQYTVLLDRSGSMQEQSVFVPGEGSATGVNFITKTQGIVISGTVTGSNKNAWIQAYGDYGFFTSTQSNGETGAWAINVPSNITLFVEAWSDYGMLTASGAYATNGQHAISVVSSNISSVNFVNDSANFGLISGSVSPAVENMTVCAEEKYIATGNYGYNFNCTGTDADGNFSINIKRNTAQTEYYLKAWSMSYGDISYDEGIDISSTNATGIEMSAGELHEITINIVNIPTGFAEGFLDIYNPNSYQGGVSKPVTFSGTSKTTTAYLDDGNFEAWLWVPGFGGINPNAGQNITISGDRTITFDLATLIQDLMAVNVTVVNPSNQPIANAWVEAFEPSIGTYVGGETDSQGKLTLYAKVSSNLNIRADNWQYSPKKVTKTKAELQANNNITITIGAQKDATVTINVTGDGVSSQDLWADLSDSSFEFWNGGTVGANGTATISVPSDASNLTLFIHASDGAYYEKTNVNPGDTVTVAFSSFSQPSDWLATETAKQPKTQSGDANGMSLSDTDNNVAISVTSGNISSSSYSAQVQTVANTARGVGDVAPLVGKQVKFLDANGDVMTSLTGTYELVITVTKAMFAGAVSDGLMDSVDDLKTMNIGYWSSATNSWVTENTTRYAYVKANSDSIWTATPIDTMTANLKLNGSYYFDWKVDLKASSVDHTTIFSPLTGSDSTPPTAPTGLSGSATSSAVTLDWNDNAEGDLLEYEIYRSATTPVPLEDANQVNTSAVTASTFIDSTVVAGTTYYYAITAVDTSHNESTSREANVAVPGLDDDDPVVIVVVAPTTGGGAVSTTPYTNEEEEEEEDEIVEEEEEAEGESGWTSEEHEVIEEEEEETESTVQVSDYENHWAKSYIEKIIEAGIASGLDEYTFMPDADLTRAEMTKMVVLAFGYNVNENLTSSPFPDVNPAEWYAPYVEAAYVNGLVSGYPDGTFQATNNINRAEAIKIIVEAYLTDEEVDAIGAVSLPFPDVELDAWYAPYVTYGYLESIVSGYADGTYGPAKNVTRAEFSKIISNLLEL